MPLNLIVTDEGRGRLLNAQLTGTDAVTIVEAGLSASSFTANPGMTALPGEIARVATAGGTATAEDTIHVSIRDDGSAAYSLRSFALYLDDGTLFAIYGQPAPILVKTADSAALIAVDCIFADISSAELSFGATNFLDPDATTTRKGLIEIATNAEAQAGADTVRAVTPAALAAALLPLLLARDGAGSGIDADLLDGQQGAWYADIAARLGFTPVNRAGDTMTGQLALVGDPTLAAHAARKAYVDNMVAAAAILARLLTVDGAGSGLDADLLDGQQGAWYADIAARLGFTPVNRAGDTMTGQLALVGDPTLPAHAARKAYVDNMAAADRILFRLLTVDGSGSGLDADLLDGQHASAFVPLSAFSTGSNANGRWWRMPDGAGNTVLEQHGRGTGTSGQQTATITFPSAFSSTDYDLQLTAIIPGVGDYDNFVQEVDGTRTVNGVTVYAQDPSSGGSGSLSGFRWRAKGY